jgi:hypothetical protein
MRKNSEETYRSEVSAGSKTRAERCDARRTVISSGHQDAPLTVRAVVIAIRRKWATRRVEKRL